MAGVMPIHSSWSGCFAIPPLRQKFAAADRKDGAPRHYTNTETRLA